MYVQLAQMSITQANEVPGNVLTYKLINDLGGYAESNERLLFTFLIRLRIFVFVVG